MRWRASMVLTAMVCLGAGSAWAATCTVNSTSDDGSSGTLRYCLAHYSSGDTINITATGTITLTSALPSINSDVFITGPGQSLLTISGAHAYTVLSTNSAANISIVGVTIANGSGSGGPGGGINYGTGSLSVADSTFYGNEGSGGAIEGNGPLTVTDCTFTSNSAPGGLGGAINLQGGGAMTVSGSTFSGNSAGEGGAIFGVGAYPAKVFNNTFSGNSAGQGAAIAMEAPSSATVNDDTFLGNSTTSGNYGALYLHESTASANNNLFVSNSGGAIKSTSSTVTGSHNVYYNNSGGDCINCNTGSAGANGNIDATSNPLTLPLGNYGGVTYGVTTLTFLPQPGSAAICAGSAALAVDQNGNALTYDQRGAWTTQVYGQCPSGTIDAGSVQTNYIEVQSSGDAGTGPGDCPSASCTLRDAVSLEALPPGIVDVDFAASVSTVTLVPANGTLHVTGAGLVTVNIIGPGANQLTVNGNGTASVFTVDPNLTATLYGLTITGGNSPDKGGGVLNQGTLTVLASTISGNTALTTGGGIDNSGALTVENSTINGNSCLYEGGGIDNTGTAAIIESTLYNNTDGSSSEQAIGGGGIAVEGGTMKVAGSTIWGNTDIEIGFGYGGGGILQDGGTVVLSNSVVSNNASPGGDIYGSYTNGGGNVVGTGSGMSGLQYNGIGATVQTLIPLPGSSILCAGKTSGIPSGVTTDERGYPLTAPSYCASGHIDAGAVQTDYTSVAFVQQPTDTVVLSPISPAPTAEVLETDTLLSSNNTDAVGGIPITVTPSGGNYSSSTLTATSSSTTPFLATFDNLFSFTTATNIDLVTSAIPVAGSFSLPAVTSSPYDVELESAPTITSPSAAAFAYGVDGSFTVTTTGLPTPSISYSSCSGNGFTGFHLTFTDNGNGTATISGEPETTIGPVTIPVSPGASVTCTLTASNGLSPDATQTFTLGVEVPLAASTAVASTTLVVGTAATAFQPVTAVNGEPAYKYTVSPALPAGLSMSASTGVISGTPTVYSAATVYTVSVADAFDATAMANFMLTVSPLPAPVVSNVSSPVIAYGTASVRLSADVTYTSGHIPSGAFTFQVGSGSVVAATCAQLSGTESLCVVAAYPTGSLLAGNYTITATQAADGDYTSSSNTGTLTVTAPPVISVSSTAIAYGTASVRLSADVTYTSGHLSTGAFTFQVGSGSAVAASCAQLNGTESICVVSAYPTGSLLPGNYTITATEAADSYYGSSSATGTLTVNNPAPAITVSPAASVYQTTSVTLTASVAYPLTPAPTGAFTFQVDSGTVVAATCTGSSSPLTCTASYNPAALTIGNHTITGSMAADTNYATASNTATLTVTAPTSYTAPTEPIGTTSPVQTAILEFNSTFTVGSVNGLTLGATGLDYNAATGGTCATGFSATPGATCTVNYTFTPKFAGARYGAIAVADESGNTQATVYLNGTGTGPQAVFNAPLTAAVLGGGFNSPDSVAVDGSGSVYVADELNNAVKEIPAGCAASSCVLTLGGFNRPTDAAVDGGGNVYVADSDNNAVKEVPAGCSSPSCVITLGGGFNEPLGVAVDGSGTVYVGDTINNAIKEIPSGCVSLSCVTTLISAGYPTYVAVDGSGNVYFTTVNSYSPVYEVPFGCTSSSCVTALGGGFMTPEHVAVDGTGSVYVTDQLNNAVKEIPAGCTSSSCVTSVSTDFNGPSGVALDGSGNVYVSDIGNDAVKKLDRVDAPTLTFATATPVGGADTSDGAQTATLANIGNQPLSVSVPATGTNPSVSSGFLYDSASTCAQLTSGSGTPYTLAPGATCTLGVDFAPTAAGNPLTGSAVFTDNSLNNPSATQTVTLSGVSTAGTATFGTMTFSPAATEPQGASQAITISDTLTYGGVQPTGAVTFVLNGVSYTASCTTNGSPETCSATVPAATIAALAFNTYTVTASLAPDSNYNSATGASGSFTVTPTNIITFPTLGTQLVFGDAAPPALMATANSGLAVSYAVTGPASVVDGSLNINGPGVVTVTASQAGNGVIPPATPVVQTLTVTPANFTPVSSGTQTQGTASVVTVTLQFQASFKLNSLIVVANGAAGTPFAVTGGGTCNVGSSYNAGSGCTVNLTYTPTGPGMITGTVEAFDVNGLLQAATNAIALRGR